MIYLLLILLGLALGSFINAFVWRLHEKAELREKSLELRKTNKQADSDLRSKIQDLSIVNGRSMCVNCHHVLAWYDLVPVFSWLSLGGKCRYCKKPISMQYPVVEVATSLLLALSYAAWPYALDSLAGYVLFGVWAIILVLLIALFLYDLKWMELPTELVYVTLVLSAVFVGISYVEFEKSGILLESVIGSAALGGLFWVLYQVSKGKWIGGGDVRLGFAMGLFLGWQKALLGLSLAAYIGTVIIVIALIIGKYHKRMKLPFGPLLIAGWYISFLWGQGVIDWYLRLIGL